MSTNNHSQVLKQAQEKFNRGDLEGYLTTLYDSNVVLYFLPPGLPPGRDGTRLYYNGFLAGFPDAQLHLDEIISDGDRLAIRFHLEMTHQGEFQGIPPTGKRVSFTGITIMRFADGKVIERWSETDNLGLLQQLGVIPESPAG